MEEKYNESLEYELFKIAKSKGCYNVVLEVK